MTTDDLSRTGERRGPAVREIKRAAGWRIQAAFLPSLRLTTTTSSPSVLQDGCGGDVLIFRYTMRAVQAPKDRSVPARAPEPRPPPPSSSSLSFRTERATAGPALLYDGDCP